MVSENVCQVSVTPASSSGFQYVGSYRAGLWTRFGRRVEEVDWVYRSTGFALGGKDGERYDRYRGDEGDSVT